jgi:hypothetical protein
MSDKGKEKEKSGYSGSPKGLNLAPELFTLQESYERQLRQKPLSHHRDQSKKTNRKAATKMGMARRRLVVIRRCTSCNLIYVIGR